MRSNMACALRKRDDIDVFALIGLTIYIYCLRSVTMQWHCGITNISTDIEFKQPTLASDISGRLLNIPYFEYLFH